MEISAAKFAGYWFVMGNANWAPLKITKGRLDTGKPKKGQAEIEARTRSNRLSMELIDREEIEINVQEKFRLFFCFFILNLFVVLGWKLQ